MPEVPEMELYKEYLQKFVKGKEVKDIHIIREKSINLPSNDFKSRVEGSQILDISRRGKYLIFHLPQENYLLTHMMLDGRLFYLPGDMAKTLEIESKLATDIEAFIDKKEYKKLIPEISGKPSVIFTFTDQSVLFFSRLTLGYLHLLNHEDLAKELNQLGIDPLDHEFTSDKLIQLLKGKKGMIKPWLMNQKYLAGVGNAYSNEALFAARILPTRTINSLLEGEKHLLGESLVNILRESIRLGGDMEEPFYPEDKFLGGYNQHFKVYDREGQPCPISNNLIIREEVGGRNAFYCPNCQH
jgi:formamidopyrimidine-DNA glycosylase